MPTIEINPRYPRFKATATATLEWAPVPLVKSVHGMTVKIEPPAAPQPAEGRA